MPQPTIYTRPAELPPKLEFLQIKNYLGEYKTEIDKAKVRFNLGIPDEYSLNWGNIGGTIEEQEDLLALIDARTADASSKYSNVLSRLSTAESKLTTIESNYCLLSDYQSLYKIVSDLLINVALNSATMLLLTNLINNGTSGGSSSSSADVTQLKTVVNDLSTNLTALTTRVDTLESNTSTISTIQAQITSLQSDVSALKTAVGSDELESLTITPSSVNVTLGTSTYTVKVYGNYSKSGTKEVTATCTCSSSNESVAVWDNTNDKINVIGKGTATLTFSYEQVSKEVVVKVTEAEEETQTVTQYVGYAPDYTQIIGNETFATNTIAKSWTSSNTPVFGDTWPMGFWVITTQTIASITNASFPVVPSDCYQEQITFNGTTYNVYILGTVNDNTSEFTITIS